MSTEAIVQELQERVARLEDIVARLTSPQTHEPGRDDWKQTVGMFKDDPIAKEIIDGALRLREEERRQVQR